MNMERDLHMAMGAEPTSYANNSRVQQKALLEAEPLLHRAVREVYKILRVPKMTISDLGCSSGENTLLFVSKAIDVIVPCCNKIIADPMELQFFLNDLPGNDFNQIFRTLGHFKESIAVAHTGETLPPIYIAGLPGSYYTRLSPRQTVHLIHSSYCLHWRSRVPIGLEGDQRACLNAGNIYIANSTPLFVVKLYQQQFTNDMLLFLKLRYEELVFGGQMVLTFLGRKNEDVYHGDLNHLCGLLAQAVQYLVDEGLVPKEKLDSFNLPIYGPSVDEVREVVDQTKLYDISDIELFQSNWDPYDDSGGDDVHDNIHSGMNVAQSIRAVMEPLFTSHFGHSVIDRIFEKYAKNVAQHLTREKTKYSVIVLRLKKHDRPV